jgi:hypothetical protein
VRYPAAQTFADILCSLLPATRPMPWDAAGSALLLPTPGQWSGPMADGEKRRWLGQPKRDQEKIRILIASLSTTPPPTLRMV